MSRIRTYQSLRTLVTRLRDDLNNPTKPTQLILLYAYNRALNLLSHGKYAIHEPTEMGDNNKDLFRRILNDFVTTFQFALPEIVENPPVATPASTPVAAPPVSAPTP